MSISVVHWKARVLGDCWDVVSVVHVMDCSVMGDRGVWEDGVSSADGEEGGECNEELFQEMRK